MAAILALFVPLKSPTQMFFHVGTPEASVTEKTPQKGSGEITTVEHTVRVRFGLGADDSDNYPPVQESIKPWFRWSARPLLLGICLWWGVGLGVLYRLFQLYERGLIFTVANIQCLKWFGAWVLACWALSNVIELSKLLTYDSADVNLRIGSTFFAGILVLLISWIMEEGGKLQEDQALTI